MSWLLFLVPIAFGLEVLAPDRPFLIFAASWLAILPLAAWMGRSTEQLAAREFFRCASNRYCLAGP